VPKTHLSQSHEYIFRHDAGKLRIQDRRDQGNGNMVSTEIFGFGRRRADRAGVAYPHALAASDALTDNVDRSFVHHAYGFGWTDPNTGGVAVAQAFIELNEA
jgi:hypothetical protein